MGANQFTTGKRTGHSEATKDKMRADKAAELLEQDMEGEIELKEGRRASAKILMEYGKPKLASVEQVHTTDFENMAEDEMLGLIQTLITSNPGLIQKLGIGLRPIQDSESVVDPLQTQCSIENKA